MIVEAMTYRIGPHSTSDDDSNYRVKDAPVDGAPPKTANPNPNP